MPIEIQVISAAQRDLVLNMTEGHFGDVKAIDMGVTKVS